MADIIKFKRGVEKIPSNLETGEPAIDLKKRKLYIGDEEGKPFLLVDLFDIEGDVITEKYAKKTKVSTNDASTTYTFSFIDVYNYDLRLQLSMKGIVFTFDDDAYESDYIAGLSFNSGETPTTISYTNSGILNWVGTDCTNADGLSIFQPSANTHYDIVFYFNGTQMIGLVNGFVPASGNVVSE